MPDCPPDSEFANFVSGAANENDASAIRKHIAECAECAETLAAVLGIQDLSAESSLPELSQEEKSRTSSAIRVALRAHGKLARRPTRDTGQMPAVTGPGGKTVLGTLLGIEALEKVREAMQGPTLVPAFGQKEENISELSVRKSPSADSNKDEPGNSASPHAPMPSDSHSHQIEPAPTLFGLPSVDGASSTDIQQHYSDTCAVRSQELVLRDFGVQISEDDLRREAFEHHWYTPGQGSSPQHIGDLLQLHGVPVNRYENANILNLTSELAQGHKVIIGVNAEELWSPTPLHEVMQRLGFNVANHALIVSGIDTSNPQDVKVVLTDPGSGDIAKAYPIGQFIEAWKDSHCFMVSTQNPAPAWLPEMAHFNYGLGHLDSIGQMPYDDFVENFDPLQHAGGELHILVSALSHAVNGEPWSPDALGRPDHFTHHGGVASPTTPDHHAAAPTIEQLVNDHLHHDGSEVNDSDTSANSDLSLPPSDNPGGE